MFLNMCKIASLSLWCCVMMQLGPGGCRCPAGKETPLPWPKTPLGRAGSWGRPWHQVLDTTPGPRLPSPSSWLCLGTGPSQKPPLNRLSGRFPSRCLTAGQQQHLLALGLLVVFLQRVAVSLGRHSLESLRESLLVCPCQEGDTLRQPWRDGAKGQSCIGC